MKTPSSTTDPVPVDAGTISNTLVRHVSLVIRGLCPSMKNRRRIVMNKRTGQRSVIKSQESLRYALDFALQVPSACKVAIGTEKTPLRSFVSVFYPSYRNDLDVSAVYDLLQQTGVISNDRWIREKHEYAHIDPYNPRVEIQIEEM